MTVYNVLLTEPIHQAGRDVLTSHAMIIDAPDTRPETLHRLAENVHGVVFRTKAVCDQDFIDVAPNLKVIGRHGVGVDNIDVAYARSRGIEVVYTPEANSTSVAEYTVGLLIALNRRIADAHIAVLNHDWQKRDELRGRELSGAMLGVIGAGRVGSRVARICRHGLEMEVCYYDIVRNSEIEKEGIKFCELGQLLAQSDVVTLHVPLTDMTRSMVGSHELAMLRPGALVLNTARGGVVDEAALIDALKSGQIRGAALDVFQDEPAVNPELVKLPNVLLSPHCAAHTEEAKQRMALVTTDILKVLLGQQPLYPVP